MKKYNVHVNPIQDITAFGSLTFYVFMLAMLFVIGETKLFLSLLWGFFFTYAVVLVIRSVYFRPRPDGQTYKNFLEKLDASSFPSLHTARIVYIATAFSLYYNSFFASFFFIALALITAYSRIHLKRHDLIDVSVGAIVGLISYLLLHFIF